MSIHRRIMGLLGSLVVATIGAFALAGPAAAANAAAGEHQWEDRDNWPLIPLHAAVDSKGRVVTYGTNGNGQQTGRFIYDVWTPTGAADQNHATLNNSTQTDLFCSLQINRADTGEMLLFGGDNWNGRSTTNTGNNDINLYNADNQTLSELPGMNRNRWYATGTTLIDGSIYIQGGDQGTDRPERWTAEDGARLLGVDTSALNYWYPKNWVIPSGHIFGIDSSYNMYTLTPDLGTLTRFGLAPYRSNTGRSTTAVMYEPGKILLLGGPTKSATIIDVTGPTPVATRTSDLKHQRSWGNATVLPDGRVLATGGSDKPSDTFQGDPLNTFDVAYNAEIWDPATGEWTELPAASRSRLYHSTALLLPDGRVFTGGGGAPGPETNTNAELFRPDYLTKADGSAADRPAITWVSDTTRRAGDTVSMSVEHNRTFDRVTLVKTGSVTHSFDMEQRFIEVPFSVTGNTINAQLPGNGHVLTPGYYHLFVLDDLGVPSVARMLHIEPSSGFPVRPRSVSGTVGGPGGTPFYDWPADNTAVQSIEISHNTWVRSLEVFTNEGTLGRNGTIRGDVDRVTINPGEYITAMFGTVDTLISSIGFETSAGRTIGPFGGGAGQAWRTEAPIGQHIVGFKGGVGTIIDRVGAVIQQRPDLPPSVVLYKDVNFTGTSWVLGFEGVFEDPAPWSGQVTGIDVPEGRQVEACTEVGGGGTCNIYTSSVGWLGDQNDDYSYFRVSAVGDPGPGQTSVGGQILDGGSNPGPVAVDLFRSNPNGERLEWVTSTATADDGTYSFDVTPGCWVVTAIAPDGRTFTDGSQYRNLSGCVTTGQRLTDLNAQLDSDGNGPTQITGSVTGPGGPVSGVAIDLFSANADGSRGTYLESTASATDGGYGFAVAPGCYVVTFIAPEGETFVTGSSWLNAPGCADPGETVSGIDAVLAGDGAGASIGGMVSSANGAPAPGVSVDLFSANADGSRGSYLRSAATEADGGYGFNVDAGCFVLTFIAPEGQTFTNGSRWLNLPICVDNGDTSSGLDAVLN